MPIIGYFDADKADDSDMLERFFAVDARVCDENQEHNGLDAIKMWHQAAKAKYRYIAEPVEAPPHDQGVLVRVRITGEFPGSPALLDYLFALAGDKITSLEIQ